MGRNAGLVGRSSSNVRRNIPIADADIACHLHLHLFEPAGMPHPQPSKNAVDGHAPVGENTHHPKRGRCFIELRISAEKPHRYNPRVCL